MFCTKFCEDRMNSVEGKKWKVVYTDVVIINLFKWAAMYCSTAHQLQL